MKEVKPQILPKPEMPPEAVMYPKLKKIDAELKQQNCIIFEAEHERSLLEIERGDLKGLARLTRKGELDRKIALKDEEVEVLKKGLSGIVRRYGFANVQESYNTFRISEDAYRRYQKDRSKWEESNVKDSFWVKYNMDYDIFCDTYTIEKFEISSTFDSHIIPADYIYALASEGKKDNKTVILVHGLGGNRN